MIIGVTGYVGSGKDTVADYLVSKGFNHYSLSDELRSILREKNIEITRENLIRVGNELRDQFGSGYLAKRVLEKAETPAVLTSIRSIGEVEALKSNKDFHLIFIDAPAKLRYDRLISRQREGEQNLTFDEFCANEKKEKGESSTSQQLHKVAALADTTIINDSTLEDLYQKIDQFIKSLKNKSATIHE